MDKALLNRSNEIYNIETNELPVNQQQIKILSQLNKQIKTLSEELNELPLNQLSSNQQQIKTLSKLIKQVNTLSEEREREREFADLIGPDEPLS